MGWMTRIINDNLSQEYQDLSFSTLHHSQAHTGGNKMWHCLKFHKLLSSIMLLLTYDIKHSTDKISETYKFSFHWKNIIKCFPTIMQASFSLDSTQRTLTEASDGHMWRMWHVEVECWGNVLCQGYQVLAWLDWAGHTGYFMDSNLQDPGAEWHWHLIQHDTGPLLTPPALSRLSRHPYSHISEVIRLI